MNLDEALAVYLAQQARPPSGPPSERDAMAFRAAWAMIWEQSELALRRFGNENKGRGMTTWDDKPNDYEHALLEIKRLRAELQRRDDETWVGLERAKDVRNAAIEECERVAESYRNVCNVYEAEDRSARQIAAAIRALKDIN